MCFVVTCWERADLLALVCGVFCEFITFPLVSWVRCGTWLYRFLIFAPLLTFIYVLCLSCFRVCSLLPCGHLLGKGWPLGSYLWCLFAFLSLSHVVSWLRCGTWLYRFLIFVAFLTFNTYAISTKIPNAVPYILFYFEPSNNLVCATSKGSDQPAHTRSLIRAFASRLNSLWVLSY